MKILLCGMGNIERGDDGFGPYIIQNMPGLKRIKIIDCGMHIENYLNTIVAMGPDLLILLDAVNNITGKTVLLRNGEILADQTLSLTTHALPFSSLYEYIKAECGADIWFVGVAPRSY